MATGYNQMLQGMSGKVGGLIAVTRGEQTVMRRRSYTNKSQTAPQKQAQASITGLAQLWSTLSIAQMDGWRTLGMQMADGKSGRPLSNYQAFTSLNGVLLAGGMPPLSDAPAAPVMPARLPLLTLDIQHAPGTALVFMVRSAAYLGAVQVYAAAPASAGKNSWSKADYKLITTLDSLINGGTPLADAYTARFGPPAAGRRIAVRLAPIAAQGFRGTTIDIVGTVSATPAAAAAPAPADQPALKAA